MNCLLSQQGTSTDCYVVMNNPNLDLFLGFIIFYVTMYFIISILKK